MKRETCRWKMQDGERRERLECAAEAQRHRGTETHRHRSAAAAQQQPEHGREGSFPRCPFLAGMACRTTQTRPDPALRPDCHAESLSPSVALSRSCSMRSRSAIVSLAVAVAVSIPIGQRGSVAQEKWSSLSQRRPHAWEQRQQANCLDDDAAAIRFGGPQVGCSYPDGRWLKR